jgi:mRNA interferase MazF
VLVVSADLINRQPLVVAVVVGTDTRNVPRDYPTNVRIPAAEGGLPIDTVFLCFRLRSPDPRASWIPCPASSVQQESWPSRG